MKREYSLKGRTLFKEVFRRGRRFQEATIQLLCMQNRENSENGNAADLKIGIGITRRYGSAVERNRSKRQLRELCRELLPEMKRGFYIIIRPKNEFRNCRYQDAKNNLRRLLKQAGVIH